MPFEIIRGDITGLNVDAVVNAANPEPVIGYGVDAGIHQKAGPQLLEARKKLGPIPVGQAVLTRGFDLPAKYVIHAVGPVWADGGKGEEAALRRTYDSALILAAKNGVSRWRFPCCPRETAASLKGRRSGSPSARSAPFGGSRDAHRAGGVRQDGL